MVEGYAQKALQKATEKDLSAYKAWLGMDPILAANEFFGLSNAQSWVNLERYKQYLRGNIGQLDSGRHPPPPKSHAPISELEDVKLPLLPTESDTKPNPTPHQSSKALHGPPKVIVISDSDDSGPERHAQPFNSKKRAASRRDDRPSKCHASTPEIIEILDSSDEEPMVIKMEEKYKPRSDPSSNPQVETEDPPKDASGRIIVTRKMKVDAVKYLPAVLTRWPIPAVDTAYVLDFSKDVPGNSETKKGKPKGLDAFLKAEDQDSWGKGTNGSTTQEVKLMLLNNLPARRSVHICNGAYQSYSLPPIDLDLLNAALEDMTPWDEATKHQFTLQFGNNLSL